MIELGSPLNDFNGEFSVLLDLIFQSEHQTLDKAFTIEKLHDFTVLLIVKGLFDTL